MFSRINDPIAGIRLLLCLLLCAANAALAQTYSYDAAGRLTRVIYADGSNVTYTYDSASNIVGRAASTTPIQFFTLSVAKTGTSTGTVTSDVGGISCGTGCSAVYEENTSVTLTAAPSAGAIFAGWSGGGCSGTGTCTATLTADTTITATFDVLPVFTLTVSSSGTGTGSITSSPAGISCGASCSAPFNQGTVVILTATADLGSAFSGWSGACTGTGTCQLTIDSAQSATATFTRTAASTVDLVPGWNLIGNSTTGTIDVTSVFSDAANATSVWKWVAGAGKWAFYTPTLQGQALIDYAAAKGYDILTTINGGEGFWVNANQAFPVDVPLGSMVLAADFQPSGTLPLGTGWNLIAIGEPKTARLFNVALSGLTDVPPNPADIPINLITLWAWDAPQQKWFFYSPMLESTGGLPAVKQYADDHFYLHFEDLGKFLDVGTGFWVNKP